MKKKVLIIAATVLTVVLGLSLVACNKGGFTQANDMMSIFNELRSKTADVGVMDAVMTGYYLKNNATYAEELQILDISFDREEYGIAFRKGSAACGQINTVLAQLQAEDIVDQIAATYGLTDNVLDYSNPETKTYSEDGNADWAYIQAKGELIIGITIFAPIAFYSDGSTDPDKLIGFDIDLAKAACEKLNLTPVFQIIDWDTKEIELASKTIDCIWNGMTITEKRAENMEISTPYLLNQQVAVCLKKNANNYKTADDLKKAALIAEKGSAGEDICKQILGIE